MPCSIESNLLTKRHSYFTEVTLRLEVRQL